MSHAVTVLDQIKEVSSQRPLKIALSLGGRTLTYQQLDQQADRFAQYLISHGVGPGCCLAVYLERSFDWVIAALGIMRAGAAYVPLDTTWPESRLKHTIRDSQASRMVTRKALVQRWHPAIPVVDPAEDAAAIAKAPSHPTPGPSPESLACVIYSSDSTGVPKGMEVTHANLFRQARVEGQIAFNTLLARLREPVFLDTEWARRQNAALRGLTRLNIGFQSDRTWGQN